MITMKQLAELAGVSQSAVSFVLSGKDQGQVSPAVAKRIRSLAEKYSYRPNMAAKGLRSRQPHAIGVIMAMPDQAWYSDLVACVQTRLCEKGYMGLFSFWKTIDEIPNVYAHIRSFDIAGLIALDYHKSFLDDPIPMVFYDRGIKGHDVVRYDYESAYRELFRKAADAGIRTAGYYAYKLDRRYRIFLRLVREFGFTTSPEWNNDLNTGSLADVARNGVQLYSKLRRHPELLVVQNDLIACHMRTTASECGGFPSARTMIAGFGNETRIDWPHFISATFDTRMPELAKLLVDTVLDRIRHPDTPARTIELHPAFIAKR